MTMRRLLTVLPKGQMLILLLVAGAGCHKSPAAPASSGDTTAPETVAGLVRERLIAGPYTYLQLRTDEGAEHWVVVSDREHRTSARLTVEGCKPRRDFVSRRLNRRFAVLSFCKLAQSPTPGARS
jgi:hypothetical protein